MKSVETRLWDHVLGVYVSLCVFVYATMSTAPIYNSLYSVINRPEYKSEFLTELTAVSV